MDPRASLLPSHLSTSERNCLAHAVLSLHHQDSSILQAAIALGFPQGHSNPVAFSPRSLSPADLAVMALLRSNQSNAAWTYPTAVPFSTTGLALPFGRTEMINAFSTKDATVTTTSTDLNQQLLPPPSRFNTSATPASCHKTSTSTRRLHDSVSPQEIVQDSNAEVLESLGANCLERRKQKVPYFDASVLSDPLDTSAVANRRTRGGVTEPFPEKLYRMLQEAKLEGKEDVVSFFPHGRAFGIHKPERFASEIMPRFFKHGRVSSFQRQLNLYGFSRINTGPDARGYYHELFLRGRPALGSCIRRVGVPRAVPRKRGVKAHDDTVDPDFYHMTPITVKAAKMPIQTEAEKGRAHA